MKSLIVNYWHIHALYGSFFLSGHGCVTRYLYKKRGEKRRGDYISVPIGYVHLSNNKKVKVQKI